MDSARQLAHMHFQLLGTRGTSEYFQEHGVNVCGTVLMTFATRNGHVVAQVKTLDFMMDDDATAEGGDPNEEVISNLDFSVPLIVNIKCAKLVVRAQSSI